MAAVHQVRQCALGGRRPDGVSGCWGGTDPIASVDDPARATWLPTRSLPHSYPWRKGSLVLRPHRRHTAAAGSQRMLSRKDTPRGPCLELLWTRTDKPQSPHL